MNTPRMRFEFTLEPAWPPLAWLAKCPKGGGPVLIVHGRRVERATAWFCEAVWTGPYAAGDFDKTDLVFGSGGRLREDSAMFVSSGSTVDRLQTLETRDAVWVSNSLACLLASLDGHVDPTYPRYFRDFQSVIRGLRRYKRTLATSAGPVRLVYFSNLRWDGQCLHEVEKARPVRDFSAFGPYRDFLASSLCRLAENMAAGERAHPFALLGTISSGYDSATIAALAREAGLREVISFEHSRSGIDDTGREIAGVLGLRLSTVSRSAWQSLRTPEIPFVAADAKGEEVHYTAAEPLLAGRVLLTGFHGDEMWDRAAWPLPLNADLVRSDQCGLSLTEYRLWAGFIHCPAPFMGARQFPAVNAISRSPELAAWDVGGAYTRPICRRILEEAGVRRDAFGVAKKNTSVLLFERSTFLVPGSWSAYAAWLAEHADDWRRRGRTPPELVRRGPTRIQAAAWRLAGALHAAAGIAPHRLRLVASLAWRMRALGAAEPLFRYAFPWALELAKARYSPPRDSVPPRDPALARAHREQLPCAAS